MNAQGARLLPWPRRMRAVLLVAFVLPSACATVATPARPIVPRVDYHQHLASPAFAPIAELPERNGAALLRELDASGIYFDVATPDQAARAQSHPPGRHIAGCL